MTLTLLNPRLDVPQALALGLINRVRTTDGLRRSRDMTMHEHSVVKALISRVDDVVRGRKAGLVHRLSVRIGELSGVDPEVLSAAYETFREQTICADAPLDLHVIPAQWECPSCRSRITRGGPLRCDKCGVPRRLVQGNEIILDRIEMKVR